MLNVATNGYFSIISGSFILFGIRFFEMIQYLIFNFVDMHQFDEHINNIPYKNKLLHGDY